jgi:tryptophan synthase beta chain
MNYRVDERGYFGEFGGAFVPEMLYPNIRELQLCYKELLDDVSFQKEFHALLRTYVGRPSPLYFAERISEKLQTSVYFKREDLNHTGSHKVNNTIGQILIAKKLGKKRIIAETGAGQHGVATATVCALKGLECIVYMGEVDMQRQQPNVRKMNYLGATVVPVTTGSRTLKDATSEAMRDWIAHPHDTHYIIGSAVGPHPYPDMVAYFQSIISAEIRVQLMEQIGRETPDVVISCVGGGSNAIGSFYHFLDDHHVRLVGVEAGGEGVHSGKTAATIALGREGVLHGTKTYVIQDENGQIEEAHSLSAGLDYPGIGPQHAHLHKTGRVQFVPVNDAEAVRAARECAQLEGIIPALETAHALAYLPRLGCSSSEVVVMNLSGEGEKDMATYFKYEEELLK